MTTDPHVLANDWAPTVHHRRFGSFRRWGPVVTVDGPADSYATAPLAGEHTDALLRELGHTDDRIAELRGHGVINSEPVVLDDTSPAPTPG